MALDTMNGFFDFFLHGLDQHLFGNIALAGVVIFSFHIPFTYTI